VSEAKVGTKGFVQCRCAEKKRAEVKLAAGPKQPVLSSHAIEVATRSFCPVLPSLTGAADAYQSTALSPAGRPPDFV
jgi:hypothetical protein